MYTHLFFFRLFPWRLLENTEFPVLYSGPLLVIYFIYSSVYLLIPKSLFIPPLPFPFGNHKSVTLFLKMISFLETQCIRICILVRPLGDSYAHYSLRSALLHSTGLHVDAIPKFIHQRNSFWAPPSCYTLH